MARSMIGARLVSLAVGASVTLAAWGCSGKDATRPGESIGVFHVSGKLVSTTCGKTPDPWAFDVRLRHDKATLYWVQGDAPVSGPIDAAARATLKATAVSTVRAANEKTKTAACTMSRTDDVEVVLAPYVAQSADPGGTTSFKGTLAYRFDVMEGSQCEDQLAESGGDFAALPCSVSYEITGARTGDAR